MHFRTLPAVKCKKSSITRPPIDSETEGTNCTLLPSQQPCHYRRPSIRQETLNICNSFLPLCQSLGKNTIASLSQNSRIPTICLNTQRNQTNLGSHYPCFVVDRLFLYEKNFWTDSENIGGCLSLHTTPGVRPCPEIEMSFICKFVHLVHQSLGSQHLKNFTRLGVKNLDNQNTLFEKCLQMQNFGANPRL